MDRETTAVAPGPIAVWDRFVRISHWTVVASFFIAYLTEDGLLLLHVWAGYVVGVLVPARIVWGFVGPRHARFTDFVCMPRTAWQYLLDLLRFRGRRHIGHSPAGGMMVVALMIGLLAVVWSGLEFYAADRGAGPLAARTLPATTVPSTVLLRSARADQDGAPEEGSRVEEHPQRTGGVWETIHEVLAHVVFTLVILHVAGVLFASLAHRENLVRAMWTGTKRGP